MHQAMVEVTQLHQVLQARLTAMGPVLDVVTLDEIPRGAPREAAATVSGPECPVNGGRDAAGLSTDVERHAISVFHQAHDSRVAGEAPGALVGKLRTVLQLRAARGVRIREHLGVYMDDDVMPLAGKT